MPSRRRWPLASQDGFLRSLGTFVSHIILLRRVTRRSGFDTGRGAIGQDHLCYGVVVVQYACERSLGKFQTLISRIRLTSSCTRKRHESFRDARHKSAFVFLHGRRTAPSCLVCERTLHSVKEESTRECVQGFRLLGPSLNSNRSGRTRADTAQLLWLQVPGSF